MTSVPIGFWRATWLLLRTQTMRYARQLTAGFASFRRKKADPKRSATPGKARRGWLFGSFVALSVAFAFINIAHQTMSNIREQMGSVLVAAPERAKPAAASPQQPTNAPAARTIRVPLDAAPGFTLAPNVLKAAVLVTLLFLLASTLLAIGNGELTQPDWDLEWLATLPLPLSTVLSARIFTRSILNPMGLSALWPFLLIVAWEAGYRWGAPAIGLIATLPLLAIGATLQTICETALRLRLGPSQLRNFQAAISVIAVIALYLAISPGMPSKSSYVVGLAYDLPAWLFWLAPGLAVQIATSAAPVLALQCFGLLVAETLICAALGIGILQRELRFGIVAAGVRESGRRERLRKSVGAAAERAPARRLLTPVQARELRLLGRDRNFLVQTLVMPVLLIGGQILFNANGMTLLSSVQDYPEHIAAIALGIATYALMFSALQTLNAEGAALWILYCVPQSLEAVLRQKAALWAVVCLIYPVTIFGFLIVFQGALSLRFLQVAAIVLFGIPIFATIATALGVFACDPLAQDVQRRVKVSYVYLYMLLSSTYIYSVYANSIWQRLSLLILTALLALALWQKARDQLPFLLDPTASPPARVSVSDGLIAALLFFVLQGVVTAIRSFNGERQTGYEVLIAFSIAGAATFAMMRLAFWRAKSEGVPRTFGRGAAKSLALGVLAGAAAAITAFVYLRLTAHTALFDAARQTALFGADDIWLVMILAVCAAPIFEEFIFRGLIFGGLRRSMGPAPSVLASAAIFAIVHPPYSVVPVFGLGIATALAYERRRLLIPPMAAHATYNALVVGSQLLL